MIRSLVFALALIRELDSSSFSVLATKLFHVVAHSVDIRRLLFSNLGFSLL